MEHCHKTGQRWPAKITQDNQTLLGVPKEILKHIISQINNFDVIMVRASCKYLFNLIAEAHPFPKHFVLDQTACASYFVTLGSVSCLEYLKNSLNFFFTVDLAVKAAECNNLSLLKYFHESGCQIDPVVIIQAATTGNLEMVKYCLESISIPDYIKTDQGTLLSRTAGAGHAYVLKYLHQLGFKLDTHTVYMAAIGNHLECLKYLVDNGHRTNTTIRSLDTMKFMNENGFDWKVNACYFAVQEQNLDMLKYAHEHSAPWGDAVRYAIYYGAIDCLKYMLENGAHVQEQVTKVGSLKILKYLVEHTDAVFSPELYSSAVECMQKDVLEYLPTLRLARPNALGTLAAECGDVEFLKWCIEDQHYDTNVKVNEEIGDTEDVLQAALSSGSFECVIYVIENNLGPRILSHIEYVESAALRDWKTADIWEYLYNIESFNITESMMMCPIQAGAVEQIEWMEQHGAIVTERHVIRAAQSSLASLAYFLKNSTKHVIGWPYGSALCHKYAIEHGCQWATDAVNHISDNVDLLRYMVHCGHVTLGPELYHAAVQQNHKKLLSYLKVQEVKPTVQSTIKSTFQSIVGLLTRK